jgi:Zn finger protein HypA/HybF involved in hydrogenase expression
MEQHLKCNECECLFLIAFTDHVLGNDPEVNFCPNCGSSNLDPI